MSDRRSHPQSATDLLRSTIHHLPRISLREAREADQTPVHRPPAPPHALPKGETPWPERVGPYHIAGEIAHGGMGTILKARDIDLGRDVALKVLHGEHQNKPDVLRRFIEEAQIASQLQHPGVVAVHGMGILPDGLPYFVMKLVKGRTLAAVLEERRDPREDRQRLLGVFEHVCQAVAYAHARRVVHRDLKPSNVMIGAFGEVQVMDWGLAKVLSRERPAAGGPAPEPKSIIATIRSGSGSSQSLAGSVLGTPAYMAPEQARGELDQVDSRSDVFGLGAILCEVLTGKPPYTAGTLEEIYHQARKGYLDQAFARLAECQAPEDLIALARRCLAYEPRERPADASAIALEVRAHLDSLEARTRRLGIEAAEARARIREERRSRRLGLVLCTAAAVLVAAAVSSWLWIQGLRDRREAEASLLAQGGLREATRLLGEARVAGEKDLARWEAAVAAVREAERRAGGGAAPAVADEARSLRAQTESEAARARASAERAQRNRDLASRLGRIAQDSERQWLIGSGYRHAFRDFGIDVEALPPDASAGRIRESGLPAETAASALAAWAKLKRRHLGQDSSGWKHLIEVADRADPDPLRSQLRRAWSLDSPASLPELYRLAAEARRLDLPPATSELLGKTLRERGAGPLALGILTRARDRWPESPNLHGSLTKVDGASILSHQIAVAALLPQDFAVIGELGHGYSGGEEDDPRALPWFEEALRLNPTSTELLGLVGLFLGGPERSSDTGRGSRFFREAFRLDPWKYGNHHSYGMVLQNSGDEQGAIREYREELKLGRNIASLNNLGYLLRGEGDVDGALAAWSEVLRQGGMPSRFTFLLRNEVARIYLDRGELAVAEHQLRLAQEYAFSGRATFQLATVLARQGRLLEAIQFLEHGIELDPGDQEHLPGALSTFPELRLPPPGDPTFEPLRQTLLALSESIEGAILSGRMVLPAVRDLLLRAHEARIEVLPPDQALAEARRLVAARRTEVPELAALEAFALWMNGEKKSAIGLLEEALRRGGDAPHLARRLEARRAEVRPDLLTFASIDAALEAPVPLVRQGDPWRFFRGKTAPSPALEWTKPGFDDSKWESGPSGFGYGDHDDATILTDMQGHYASVLIRRGVELPAGGKWERVELRVVSDDGFAAFVNGEEAGRFRAPAPAELAVSSRALKSHEADAAEVIDVTGLVRPGENLLALQGLNDLPGSSDFSLIPELWMFPAKDPESGAALLDSFRGAARGEDAPARLAYLEGRIQERAGRLAEALAAFERAGAASPRDPEPLERTVAALDALGRGREVRPRLEAAFRAGVSASRGLLRRWASPPEGPRPGLAELLAGFPLRADPYEAMLLPRSSQKESLSWRFTDQRAPEGWERDGFDDSGWREGRAPFGNSSNEFIRPITPWLTPDLWIRREFDADLPDLIPERLRLSLTVRSCHDDDAEVYLNGVEIARFSYWSHNLYAERTHRGALPLRKGRNVIAAHCHNTGESSQLDLELVLRIVAEDR